MLTDWLNSLIPVDWHSMTGLELAVEWIAMVAIGVFTGIFGVIMGVGGGIFIAPMLRIFPSIFPDVFPPLDAATVAGTALALVAVNGISGGIAYRRMRRVDKRSAYMFAAAAMPGSIIGVFGLKGALESLPGIFDTLFGVLLLLLALRILTQQFERQSSAASLSHARRLRFFSAKNLRRRVIETDDGVTYRYRLHEPSAVAVNFIFGFVSSFFGVGGGFLRVPVLAYAFRFPVQIAASTSIFAIAFYAPIGAVTHAFHGHVELITFLFIGAGLIVGSQIGARLSSRIHGVWVMRGLMALVAWMGLQLIWQGLF